MHEAQLRAAGALDAALRRVHSDMHHLSGGLLDVFMSVQRLEDKLDRLAAGAAAARGGRRRAATPKGGRRSPAAREDDRRSASRGPGPEEEEEARGEGSRRAARGGGPGERAFGEELGVASRPVAGRGHPEQLDRPPRAADPLAGPAGGLLGGGPALGDALRVGASAPEPPSEEVSRLEELGTRLAQVDRKVDRIVGAMGIKGGGNEGDDDEDRRRLKEKLKVAIELDRRSRIRTIVSSGEVWLEYLFGICRPDQRMGKRGSRWWPAILAALPRRDWF